MIGSRLIIRAPKTAGPVLGASRQLSVDALFAAFFKGRSPHTIQAYKLDLEDFTRWLSGWLQIPNVPREALRVFLSQGAGSANELVVHYRDHCEQRGLATASVNRRLASIRSIVRFARMIGVSTWMIEVAGRATERVRDTRGPVAADAGKLLASLAALTDPRGIRDFAMIRLMLDLGLRVAEVVGLDVADLDEGRREIHVLGKGRRAKIRLSMPERTAAALRAWLDLRGRQTEGPLFTRSRASLKGAAGGRLDTRSVYRQVRMRGRAVGLKLWPHALRHTAITAAVEAARANDIGLDEVRQFSRHKHLQTLLEYRDETRNVQGQLAALVAEATAAE